ncbi:MULTISPECIES: hypothetical protein [unclassified Clostridioides]|uniref:hypothetical protein n=1 Tax=unclassified Clostridioides TaxID=2635829 RepID=UPI001D12DB6F|nr:hypothetical protein [Clostridioides sp. ES-S-0005-03]UDN63764.1 hypothetical protein IC758_10020 [Clostridioides sp. ES-W-0016-02]
MSGFRLDLSRMMNSLTQQVTKSRAMLGVYADTASRKLETEAKTNHPWQNRSHDAESRLKGSYEWQGDNVRLALSHGVDYGVFLEKGTNPHIITARNGGYLFWDGASHPVKQVNHPGSRPYPIIMPTIEGCGPEILRGLNCLFGSR